MVIGCRQGPVLYPAYNDQYEYFLKRCGLTLTQKDQDSGVLSPVRPLTEFEYTDFSWRELFSPGTENSTAFAAAIVRIFTAPFGLKFHTDYLLIFWCAVLCTAVFFVTSGLKRSFRYGWSIIPGLLCLLFTDGNFMAVFRSLYPQGAMIAFGLLYFGFLLDACVRRRTGEKAVLLPAAISGALFLTADTSMLLFLPFAVCIYIWFLVPVLRDRRSRFYQWVPACFVMLAVVLNVVAADWKTDIYFSKASRYQSVFNTMLPASDDPSLFLLELGLDSSYLPDVGKTYDDDPSGFSHSPAEDEKLFSALTVDNLLFIYQTHPQLLFRVIKDGPAQINSYVNPENLSLDKDSHGNRFSRTGEGLLGFVRRILPYNWPVFAVCILFECLTVVILSVYKRRISFLLLIPAFAGALLYLPSCVILCGYRFASQYTLFQVFLMDMVLGFLLTGADYCLERITVWALRYSKLPAA